MQRIRSARFVALVETIYFTKKNKKNNQNVLNTQHEPRVNSRPNNLADWLEDRAKQAALYFTEVCRTLKWFIPLPF